MRSCAVLWKNVTEKGTAANAVRESSLSVAFIRAVLLDLSMGLPLSVVSESRSLIQRFNLSRIVFTDASLILRPLSRTGLRRWPAA